MFNPSESDKKFYANQERRRAKRQKAIDIAKARGSAAEEWLKANKLTKETQHEFNKLMKSVDIKFKEK